MEERNKKNDFLNDKLGQLENKVILLNTECKKHFSFVQADVHNFKYNKDKI